MQAKAVRTHVDIASGLRCLACAANAISAHSGWGCWGVMTRASLALAVQSGRATSGHPGTTHTCKRPCATAIQSTLGRPHFAMARFLLTVLLAVLLSSSPVLGRGAAPLPNVDYACLVRPRLVSFCPAPRWTNRHAASVAPPQCRPPFSLRQRRRQTMFVVSARSLFKSLVT